jgi:hypothetical protein
MSAGSSPAGDEPADILSQRVSKVGAGLAPTLVKGKDIYAIF